MHAVTQSVEKKIFFSQSHEVAAASYIIIEVKCTYVCMYIYLRPDHDWMLAKLEALFEVEHTRIA
jgi:hypothetical protein